MKFPRCFQGAIVAVAALVWADLSAVGAENGNAAGAGFAPDRHFLLYVGTYTGAKSKGIYAWRLDSLTGKLAPLGVVAETPNPTFLAVHPSRKFLYAANEISEFNGKPGGAVSAFALDAKTGQLNLLNQASTVGPGPCHLVVDKSGRSVLVANYGGGSVAVLPVGADGRLGEATTFIQHTGASVNPDRQKEPHAHSINLDAANHFAFAADLGLDKVFSYRFDAAKGLLTANEPAFTKLAAGAGPRHFAFHPAGRHAYVINELHCTITAFAYDAVRGELKEQQTVSTLPPGETVQAGYSTAEVVVHPGGRLLYGSNRGHNTLAVYAIDAAGRLQYRENISTQGKTPRNFAIDPTGRWLFAENQDSGTIVPFRIDRESGHLTPSGSALEVGSPVCIKFVPLP